MEWFEDDTFWADFAGALFAPERLREARAWVATSPLLDLPPGTTVLDLGCGPGTYAVPLAERGARVTGVDLSGAMLDRAREAAQAAGLTVRLVRADMREFVEPHRYDEVVSMYTSFGYFADPAQNQLVLRNAWRSLVPGGRLLMDLFSKEIFARWAGTPKVVEVDGGSLFMRDTILDDWTRFRSDWTLVRGGTARHGFFEQFVYSAAEIRSMLAAAGFTDIVCFGGFAGEPYDNNAKRLVVQATRPREAEAGRP
ncbi:methyltransferase [Sphaerisporangium krabiense]|uniref:SAM-dependent methyltransferase n=1 Tax=Sphaerisporangium krabiense TaxID=763782 RepID=A0A7W8Z2A9_9ACTN|nr:class I SAM-dependent methyltransferase [Sphaerisporangium krabiense]MBB5625858.1 SAM-dependent methyltransferase [Sphaerisporangium krabiense]GII64662.1 methyltransferase [Sphaerisporangium krabiense]